MTTATEKPILTLEEAQHYGWAELHKYVKGGER